MLKRVISVLAAHPGVARAWPLLVALALVLASCGNNTPNTIHSQIEDGDAAGALNALAPLLEEKPADPTFNLLALKATLAQCVQLNCPTDKPAMLADITRYANASTQPVTIHDNLTLDVHKVLAQSADAFANLPNQPGSILTLLPILPESSRLPYINALFTQTASQIRDNRIAPALENLRQMANADQTLGTVTAAWSGLMHSLLGNQRSRAESYLITLRANQKGHTLPPAALALVPHALFASLAAENRPNATVLFTQTLVPLIKGWGLPTLVDDTALRHMGAEINRLRTNPTFLKHALAFWPNGDGSAVVATLSGTTVINTPGAELQFALSRLSLGLNPDQPTLWAEFLPLAKPFIQGGGDLTDLANALQGRTLPPDVQDAYLSILFQLVDTLSKKGQPFLPVLEQTTGITMDKTATTKLEKLVQTGLEKAIASRNITDIVSFATFKPDIARNNRQALVPQVVDAVREALRKSDFDTATTLAEFLQKTMAVDFNMDALILQEFDTFVQENKLADALSAETPEWLLQPQAAVTYNLGPLFTFMQNHFANKPDILNAQLKTLVGLARGTYGVASAMYRLNPLFDDRQFPLAQRTQYLAAALQNALMEDATLTGPQLAEVAGRLHRLHPGLVLPPVVENALDRCATLEDSRKLWQSAPPELRKALSGVRPQFTALMNGIDAFDRNQRTRAAAEFAKLNGPTYLEQAEPYLAKLLTQLADIAGIYAPTQTVKGNTQPSTILIKINVPSLTGTMEADIPINQVELTLVNQLGSSRHSNPNTLTTSHADVTSFTMAAEFDFDTGKIILTDETKSTTNGSSGFDNTYGALESLRFSQSNGNTLLTLTQASSASNSITFQRLYRNPQAYLKPDGRYSITGIFGAPPPAAGTILPTGALIQFKSEDPFGTDIPSNLPLTGHIWHPASSSPLTFTGTYQPHKAIATFDFAYPLPGSGSMVKAQVTCQTVPGSILCGSHFLHSARQQYNQLVQGVQTHESRTEREALRANLNATYQVNIKQAVKNLPRTSFESFLPETATPASVVSESTLLSATTPSGTLPPQQSPAQP